MLKVCLEHNKPSLTAAFMVAHNAMKKILNPAYFTKTNTQIINDYRENEFALTACASSTNVQLLSLYDAVKEYQKKVADQIDAVEFP